MGEIGKLKSSNPEPSCQVRSKLDISEAIHEELEI